MRTHAPCWLATAILFVSCGKSSPSPPAIELGHDTTRITQPLKADGTPDYVAALNARYSDGVTEDNNAVIPLLKAFGPAALDDNREPILLHLGLTLEESGDYFVENPFDLVDDESRAKEPDMEVRLDKAREDAWEKPWTTDRFPEIARWLERNESALELVVEASRRERFYFPIFLSDENPTLVGAWVSDSQSLGMLLRDVIEVLAIRANLAWAEGRFTDALSDIEAMSRLGFVTFHAGALIDCLIGLGGMGDARECLLNLAKTETLPVSQIADLITLLESWPVPESAADAMDVFERYAYLDAAMLFRSNPQAAIKHVFYLEGWEDLDDILGILPEDDEAERMKKLIRSPEFAGVDWNRVLRLLNGEIDQTVSQMRLPTAAQRLEAAEKDRARLAQLRNHATQNTDEQDLTFWVYSALSAPSGWGMSTLQVQLRVDAAREHHVLTKVALALAAHRALHGSYPQSTLLVTPLFADAIPHELFANGSWVYRRTDSGYLLYSIGPNLKDDGGNNNQFGPFGGSKDDIVIRVGQEDTENSPSQDN